MKILICYGEVKRLLNDGSCVKFVRKYLVCFYSISAECKDDYLILINGGYESL